jgi:hypothetical protein
MCSVWVHGFLLASAILAERGRSSVGTVQTGSPRDSLCEDS